VKQGKPFYRCAVFWQSVASLFLFPLAALPGRIPGVEWGELFVLALLLVYLLGVIVSVFWSMTRMISDIMAKSFDVMTSLVPMLFSGVSAYILFAAGYGWWPFAAGASLMG
jgi:hypothetical protein